MMIAPRSLLSLSLGGPRAERPVEHWPLLVLHALLLCPLLPFPLPLATRCNIKRNLVKTAQKCNEKVTKENPRRITYDHM